MKIRGQRGFITLVEVLIGMTLLGIMMSLLFGVFRIGVSSWDAGEQRAIEVSTVSTVQNFLRARLATAQPLFDDFSDDEAEFSFIGKRESLQFVSSLRSREGLKKFRLFLDRNNRGTLKISVQPFFPVFEGSEPDYKEDLVLLETIEFLEFSYFGADSFGEEADWTNRWDDQNSLPQLVKLDIRFKDKSESSWPPMTVNFRVESLKDDDDDGDDDNG